MRTLEKVIAILCCIIFLTQTTGKAEAAGNKLKIVADHANVDVKLAENGQYSYKYDSSKFTVTTDADGSVFKVNVNAKKAKMKNTNQSGFKNDKVTVFIPKKPYTRIVGVSKKGGLSLPAVNANITVKNKLGSAAIRLPSNYSKTVNYTGVSGSGALAMNENKNFAINAKFSGCAVAVPGSWPAYSNGNSSYSYTKGKGAAKINIDLTGCSFSFVK